MADGRTSTEDGLLRVSRSLTIPVSEIGWRASPSGGPGGQHANKTSSRVEVRFDVLASSALGPRQRARLLRQAGPVIRATSSDERSQARNRQLALERLAHKISAALRSDKPRVATKPTLGAKERRLQEKHRRSAIKRSRHEHPDPDS
jgi:ribosome-associated protein